LEPSSAACEACVWTSSRFIAERSLGNKEASLRELQNDMIKAQENVEAARQGKDALAVQLAIAQEELKVQQESLEFIRAQRQRMTEELARLHREDAHIRGQLNVERYVQADNSCLKPSPRLRLNAISIQGELRERARCRY
jgi:aspartate carbamoyltransferase catalytic subunit